MDDNKSSGFMLGMIIGCLIGAAVAALLTPKTGEEIREKLKESYLEGREKVKDLKASMEGFIEKGKGAVQDKKEKLMESISKHKERFGVDIEE